MEYRPLGDSGLMVSVVGIGCNAFGRRVDLDGVRDVLDAAPDVGITLLDTADIYGDPAGGSEELIGRGAEGPARRLRAGDQVRHGHARRQRRRLGRPRLAALHPAGGRGEPAPAADRPHRPVPAARPDDVTPIEETLSALDRARARGQGPLPRLLQLRRLAGRRRRVDLAQRRPRAVRLACRTATPCSTARSRTRSARPASTRVGILPFFPLAYGLLTGKYRRGEAAPAGTRPATTPSPLARERRLGPDRGARGLRRGARPRADRRRDRRAGRPAGRGVGDRRCHLGRPGAAQRGRAALGADRGRPGRVDQVTD